MEYRNPRYNPDGSIDCEINSERFGWSPFTASPNDVEPHGRELFERIVSDGGIEPYVEPETPTPTVGQIRTKRNELLADTDWTQVADAPVDQAAWATYRQALRDVPEQEGFPVDVVWPEKP